MKTDEKTGVLYRQWEAPSAEVFFLLVHGLGGHSSRWEFLSQFLLQNRISSYAIELKGFGETKDLKGHIDSFEIYFQDLLAIRNIINQEHRGAKVFLLGESLGGLLAFLLAIRTPNLFHGLICLSPAFKGSLKSPFMDYVKVFVSMFFNPRKQFPVPFNAQMCTRDTDYQGVMDSDPREHRLATAKLLIELFLAQIRAGFLKHKLSIPTLFLTSGKDFLVDTKAISGIFKKLVVKDKTIIDYPDMYHALPIELGREKVFADILKWAQERLR